MWTVITVRVLLALDLNTALAQEGTALSASQVEEIIVTAEKWEQAASTIGMSITTATDDMLQERECPTIGHSLNPLVWQSPAFQLRRGRAGRYRHVGLKTIAQLKQTNAPCCDPTRVVSFCAPHLKSGNPSYRRRNRRRSSCGRRRLYRRLVGGRSRNRCCER
jgi:hypothetical protein